MALQKIVIFSGLPGSGKSTVSESLAKQLAYPLFSVDPIESAILRSGIQRNFETGLASYLVAQALAEEQLKIGLSVIIDAVNSVQEARDMWVQLAQRHHATLCIIECTLETTVHKKRIEARVRGLHGIPETTWETVEQVRREYLPWVENRLVLHTEHTDENTIKRALEYIES